AGRFSPIDGRAGVGAALNFENANVKAYLNGTAKAAGTVSSGGDNVDVFDPSSAINVDTDTFTIHDHGFANGQLVQYNPFNNPSPGIVLAGNQSDSIGGLEKGKTYAVVLIDADHFKLAKDPVIDLDANGTDPTATQTLNVLKSKTFDVDAIDSGTGTITIAAHGFADGDQVEYFANGNTAITGLTDHAIYTVVKSDDASFQLKNSSGALVPISQD